MKRADIALRIAELLDSAPPDLWRVTGGDAYPTLDLYLYLCAGLGVSISVDVEPVGANYLRAVATLTHGSHRVQADALGMSGTVDDEDIIYGDLDPMQEGVRLSAVQSLAVVRACRMYLQPYLAAARPSVDHALVTAVTQLYREQGYREETMLQHASHLLRAPVSDLAELTRAELVEILVSSTSPSYH